MALKYGKAISYASDGGQFRVTWTKDELTSDHLAQAHEVLRSMICMRSANSSAADSSKTSGSLDGSMIQIQCNEIATY